MKIIQSLQNEFIKSIEKLHDKKIRIKTKTFLLEGYHLVEEAKKHNLLQAVLATNEKNLNQYSCDTYLVTEQIIKKLSTTVNPQNIIAVAKMPEFDPIDLNKNVKLVILDGINDPGNLGSIIRTAAAFGYSGVICSENTVDVFNEKSIRATQGAIFKIPVIYTNLQMMIKTLKNYRIKCIGTTLKKSTNLEEFKKEQKFAITFGNEAQGMREEILNLMDVNLKISMMNEVESLNVLSASSIIMYELQKENKEYE